MGGTNRDADMLTVIEQNCNYSAFLAIALGQMATEYTTYSILFVEFLINLYKVLKIVNLSKKIKADAIEKEKLDPKYNEITTRYEDWGGGGKVLRWSEVELTWL